MKQEDIDKLVEKLQLDPSDYLPLSQGKGRPMRKVSGANLAGDLGADSIWYISINAGPPTSFQIIKMWQREGSTFEPVGRLGSADIEYSSDYQAVILLANTTRTLYNIVNVQFGNNSYINITGPGTFGSDIVMFFKFR